MEILRGVTRLHQAFERLAAAEPEAVVLVAGEERITRGELDARANRLARFLAGQGVGPEVRVAVCAERTPELVVALYAVLKAGGAYVPVDPAYPEERQAAILGDSGALLLLTQERLVGRVPRTSAKTVFLDRHRPEIELYSDEPLESPADERNLAYVIYTSGSTGRPKGVAIEHHSAVTLTRWAARIYSPEELSGVLAATSVCFDMSIFELFVTPALGGRAILADHALSLPELPAAGEVTLVNTVPSAIAELARSGGIPPSVVTVNLGGEALRASLVNRLYELGTIRKVYNVYGPSEDTTFSTWALVPPGDAIPSVGRLLDGEWGYLLDRDLERAPTGEPGELYIGGAGLSRGYLGRPDMTAARYVPDPFAPRPGERIYATGDLIRYRRDGELDYLGRIDHQVKIRGFRVELGEIETTLERHPAVGDTVVVALDLSEGSEAAEKVLVAYVVPRPGMELAIPELREHLRQRLAEYMVPTHFVVMEALPLSPNGKVDRKALPKPEISGGRPGLVAPRTPLEVTLAGIWSEVLGVPGIGIGESFFELGGHSLLAARAIARIHEVLGRRLSPRALFEATTVEQLAALLADLPVGEELAGIPVAKDRRWTASASQEGMWFLDRLHPELPIFTIPLRLDLAGPLDRGALHRSLAEVVRRHEVLRVAFLEDGQLALALADAAVELPRIDLRALPPEARMGETERVLKALAGMHIRLDRVPLLRGHLIERNERSHSLLITMHHAVGDDWSTWVLAHDLAAFYSAAVEGRPAALPALPVQFSDYAAWQREWLRGEEAREQLAFWRRHLAGAPEVIDLPTDRPRPPAQSFRGHQIAVAVPPRDVQTLLGLALRSEATLFMALLAVTDVLLHRYSGQSDLVVGAQVANRHRAGTQELIGFFTNTLVLRAGFQGEPAFLDLLGQAREAVLAGLDRQDFPFDQLVRELSPGRNLVHAPLAQVFLSFQNTPPLPAELGPGLGLRLHELGTGASKVDLTLYLRQEGGTIVTVWEYASALFDPATISRMAGHFQVLLAAAAADPRLRTIDLPLLTDEEREQLLVGFNDTGSTSGPDVCLHQLFEAQAARVPDQVALIAPDARLTYQELNERAETLAHRLRALGLGPERLAGVLMDRTADLIVTLLAIHKAGGAYAPLDPNYPKQRVLLMLETARATVLVTRHHLAVDLPEGVRTVFLDPGWEGEPVAAAEGPAAMPDNLAYVIFTSGSTGVPKGVAIQHRSAVAMVRWCHSMFSPEEYAGVLVSTSICFDMSVFEIFATLAAGGRLILAENALALPELEAKDEVVLVDTVPSAMAELLRIGRLPSSIATVNLGGEPLKASLVREIYEKLPNVTRVVNLYGPSEDTTFTSWAVVPRDTDHPLIGRPLTGEQAYVLDREMRPAPVGVPGALYMGGEGVTRGYLHRPDLTAERYIPNPYGPPGSRLYTVGDLVRYLPTGELDYLGRLDHQVKVRGFRIELGEIESALTRHSEVREAAVLATPDLLGGNRLIAYVETERDLPAAELRSHLKQSLPDYMVPSLFVNLRELPLTPNGKIDRRALAALPLHVEEGPQERAPCGYVEEVLAEIWSEIFGHPVKVEDNFFDLGGHSLLATRVISRVREAFGIELPVRRLFEQPTIAGLARSMEVALGVGRTSREARRIGPAPDTGSLPLSFAQQRLWFLDQLLPDSAVYNLPHPLSLEGTLETGVLQSALTDVVRRHETLRTTFPSVDGEPCQVIAPAGPFPLPVIDLGGLAERARSAEAEALVKTDSRRPFDLGAGPLFRTALLKLGRERHILLLTMHHIVSDGWSVGVLVDEVKALYEAFLAGLPSPLPELPIQYAAFAVWQRDWLRDEVLERQLAYWRERLASVEPLPLPTDRLRPGAPSYCGARVAVALSPDLSGDLARLSQRREATPYMLFLAAFQALLSRLTGEKDLTVGSPVAGRNRAEVEPLIGFFVNTLVLRGDLAGDPPFRELLARARREALEAFAHQDVPFEQLVEALRPQRILGINPFFQVLYAFQNAPRAVFDPPGLSLTAFEVELPVAKFDLELNVWEEAGSLRAGLTYATDLFDPATARRMAGHFERLLGAVAADDALSLSALPLLAPGERHQLLAEWNDAGPAPEPATAVERFAAQAAATPEALALVAGDEQLTYTDLDARSNRLARRLRRLGVGLETVVGLFCERTPELAVGILAVWKAGGAYLPLDPGLPPARLAYLLEDSQASVILAPGALAEALPPSGAQLVLLDSADGESDGPLDGGPAAHDLAYLIYTSGTTGNPKAVQVEHGNLASTLAAVQRAFGFRPGDRLPAVATFSFDIFLLELLGPLLAGGSCVLVPLRPTLDLERLARELETATLFHAVPALMRQVVDQVRQRRAPSALRALFTGGDMVPADLLADLRETFPGAEVHVLYGPTEAAIVCTSWQVPAAPEGGPARSLLGRPFAGVEIELRDADGSLVPVGVTGEIWIGGRGVARGYWRREELTTEKFVAVDDRRFFRSGDQARRLPDGTLEFLGRVDQQVKVRGFRVEPGEIESALTHHPEVREVAVLAMPDLLGGNRLIAYVETGRDLPAADLRAHLKQSLPDYMVPSAFVTLRELPLTPNGKIDRRVLAAMPLPAEESAENRAPQSHAEEVVARIWSGVFGRTVGVEDNFFDLGGHSLLATRVVSRVSEAFGIELPVLRLFEQPTIAGLARSVEEILGAGISLEASRIEPAPRTGPLPLSFSQRRLWFLDQLLPNSAVYNIPYRLNLEGPLEAGVLQDALTEVVRRHEALRTTFPNVDGEPCQAIAPAVLFPLPMVDLGGLGEPARSAEAEVLSGADSLRPFDLVAGPLFRAALLKLGRERHVLLLTLHHVISDGWSMDVLLRELAALYEAFAADRPSPLPELPVQYADFAVWQRRWLSGEALARQLDYWRRQLAGAPAGLDLPTDFPRPAMQTFHGATRSAQRPAEDLRAFCRREGVTLFMLLLAGFDVLLSRYSGQRDVLVGSPVANRNRAETEGLIGFFVNTLVLRADLDAADSFRDLLRQARETALAAYGHQDLPFETLVEELKPERDLSRSPFFQVLLSVQALQRELPSMGPLRLSPVLGELDSAKFDLSLFVADAGETLEMTAEYNTDLFAGATVQRLLGHLGRLLEAAVADPERSWRDLPLLTEEEREQLLVGFNDTASTSGPDVCLHQLFEAQVARVPDQVALVATDARLTYRELNERAETLAHRLRALGLGPERLAGVLMDRTADLVVTLLAIHKTGGAYAPLDPNYPKQRVLLMLETARATVLVTRRHLAGELPVDGMRTVFLDPGWEDEPIAEVMETAAPEVLPDNLAYVIFTSGSTGTPKGVAIQHRSAVAMVRWCHSMFSPEEYAGVLVSTSICFDMSVFEIFATLAIGGRLILAENALALPELEGKDEVVLVDTVPSAMTELLRIGRLPSSITTVNLGGEPLKASLVREIYEKLPNVTRVVNLYGPSEDTTFTSYAVVPADTDHPLIGRPLTGEQAYVLDREMRPAPIGVPGALYMGGEGVTRGYLHRPDLTAERYVPNPYGPRGSRLYTVGDLVRYLPTGELDYLGRLDHQVKVRGFRIELGEIESALTLHPEVREAAVLATPDLLGGNRLIAYVETERDLPAADLRAHLKQSLPDYMVPSLFVTLRELPLTPNGKIDRRVLATLPLHAEESAGERGPQSYAEEVLAGIWSEIFGRAVEVEDNFFDLGGHSLLATRVVSQVREAFRIELPVRRLFEQPTVAGLARSVEAALGAGSSLEAPRIEPAPRTGPLPLSFSQRRLWFLDQLLPDSAVYNIPYPLNLEGPLDTGVLQSALVEVVRRHEALRTTFPSVDGEPCQAIAPAVLFPLPVVDLGGLGEPARSAETESLLKAEFLRPFDLGAGPLFRTTLFKLGRERHVLLLTLHHIVSDGWSMDVLLRELAALYEAFAAGRPSPLPELPVQYADFAVWQRRWLSGEALARQLDYWRRQLAGAPAGLDLPTDFPRPAMQTFHGATRSAQRPAEDLRAFCRREGVTLFMLLLAGFDVLLSRYSGQRDVLVGSPVANRNRAETEGLIGFFVNTLVLRANLDAADSFRDLLRQARETALAAYGHQDLPFETLVEELKPERDLSRSPFFQVLLSVQALQRELPSMGPLRLSPVEGELDSAKFDLSLFVADSGPELGMTAEYNTDLFAGATVQRLLGHLGRLLEAAVADPEQGWRDLPLLTEEEREQLLVGFNDTASTSGPDVCLHQLFEAQAARVPDQVALIAPDARLTYRELNERAEKLAHRLRALGLGPERLAGVLMDRTADLIVTLLAIHKAGGAYAPLDPNYPKQRVLLMLETARAAVLVTRRDLAGDLPVAGMRTVFLDPGWESEPVEAAEGPAALPGNLAYVIFTSGSTGVPKGVAIQHRSAVAMVRWCHSMFSPAEYVGVLVSTSICFDMSVFEIFATLAIGGRLILAENALALPELEAKDEVVLVDTVPSAMAELLRIGRLPSSITTVNLGGEPLKASLVREIYEKLPNVTRVVNLYGPSEDTTFTSYAVVPADTDHPLIGRPLTGEQAYVLDREMRPAPIGVPGALYMGGEGVTRGYLHRPDLTAERYIPNPYGPPGSRLYTVGDLVRYLPTGELDYLGRLDHQVKVRGFRIEMGEIESALTRHPEVREAAVLATPDLLGGNRLIAYVETERDLPAADLRVHLKQSLPDYMVPSLFVTLRELPLTPNGKIDRRALTALPLHVEEGPQERAPRGYVEEVLAGIWSEIFGHPVKVDDNFFDLGGHSLLATRVISRIRVALNVELPLQQLFTTPTLRELAARIEEEIAGRRGVPLPPIRRISRAGDLPLSFAQQRLWFLNRLEPGMATFNMPVPLRLRGRVEVTTLSRTLDEIVRRHESLRTVFGEREGRGIQVVRPPAPVALPFFDLSGLPAPEAEARLRAQEDARRPFDLARGPLFRSALLKLGEEDWLLLVNQHHIVSDGWSAGVFTRELREIYEAFAASRPSPLPELPVQYPDFAAWQREALSGEAVENLLEDWKRRFGASVPNLQMPTDRPRPAVQTYPGAHSSLQLSPDLARGLQTLAQRSGVTLFMTLIAAFQALLHRYSGQERVVVGSPVAGRDRPELEGLIGFFVNTLVLPGDLSGDLTFRQLLERAREMALGAYACQDLPFEKLVEALLPVRDKSRSPLFQAMFLFQHAPEAGQTAPEGAFRIESFGVGTGTSQFDLTLAAAEGPDGLLTAVEYNTDLFDATTMDRLLENYRALLEAVVTDPEVKVGEIPLMLPTRAAKAETAPVMETKPESTADARRDRLSSRLSKLSVAQREALERRLKGGGAS